MGAEPVVHDAVDRLGKLLPLGLRGRVGVGLDELLLVFRRQGHRPVSGRMVTQLRTHLEPDEASRPGRESAVTTKLARLADDQQQRIGGCLARDVVEVRAAEVMCGAPLPDLGLRGAKKYRVQITAGALVVHSPAGQSIYPSSVLSTEGVAGRGGLPSVVLEASGLRTFD